MSTDRRKTSHHARAARGRRRSRTPFVIGGTLAVVAIVAIIWYGVAAQSPGPSASPSGTQVTRVRGLATAPLTIDEYADFQCPACGQFARTTETQLTSTYIASGQVRLVFHHFAFLGIESNWAAEAAECAGEQGRFWEFHDRLFASQSGENKGAFSKANLKKIGADLGLGAGFDACVDSGRYATVVRESTQEGTARGVRATPTLFVGGTKFEGAPSYQQLKAAIDTALGR